jgi:glycosyltransferase involved in cell wall biosynthesis/nucleotide-binding universal stress UspA family protein
VKAERGRCRIVVAGTTREEIANLLPFARALAQVRAERILILGLISVPESESLSRSAGAAQRFRQELEQLPQLPDMRITVRVAHEPWREASAVIGAEECDLMLVSWPSTLPEDALREMPCDVVVVKGAFPEKLRRILLPIRGGPTAAVSLQIALAFAQAHQAEITLLHAMRPSQVKNEEFREFFTHLRSIPEVTKWIKVHGDAVRGILDNAKAREHQLLIMGAIARPQPGDPPIGPTATRVVQAIDIPALMVKTKHKPPVTMGAAVVTSTVDYTISVVVDKWFAENTFHAHEFENLKRLVEKKEEQGLTISLGLPALNEEKTIGKVIKTVRRTFIQRYPLLDEIVVIDSNSTDHTVEIAQDLGVPVVKHPDILTEYGVFVGKGEALWTSLYVLKGDLIAWIDTDIVNIHPRFVYGILGPLIQEPRLMYVKGFYQRPLRVGLKLEAQGGGRVTELVARPLLNLFYPELSGMIQPLAGEYAGRREALESVPFFTGYGVETGLLIDILNRYGLNAIGQVDLEERVHRNQPLLALSRMAFAIMQVVMLRAGEARQTEILNWMNASLKLIHQEDEEYRLEVIEIRDHERPPMISVPEYRAVRGLLAA